MDYEALEKGILELIEELKNTPGKELLTEYVEEMCIRDSL